MATKGKPTFIPQQVEWVNYDLTKEDKARMKKQFPDPESINDGLEALINTGFKLSLGYDGYGKCFVVSLFPTPNNPLNRGFALSARATTPFAALRGALYRHFTVFEGNWRSTGPRATLDDAEE